MSTDSTPPIDTTRRSLIQGAAAVAGSGLLPGLRTAVWAAGSDKPEKEEVRIGFIPLTDCASVVMASVLGFDKKYGVKIVPSKEASWAGVRDKLVNGELDMAHVLYGLIYGVQVGAAGPKKDMAVLMNINHNGQAISLSKQIADKGAVDGPSLAKLMAREKREYTFAGTFPTSTHTMWLDYWLAASGVNPVSGAKIIVVPPPQMVANMRVGNMDGCCVGEPWNARAIMDGVGITADHLAGHLEGPPGEGPRHPARLRQEEPQHLPRRDDGRARGQQVDRRPASATSDRWRRRSPRRATSTPAST